MFLRPLSFVIIGAVGLALSGLSAAQQYRADEFLTLDLSQAVLSPKPLGPAMSFTPGPLDVTIGSNKAAQANAQLLVDPKTVAAPAVHAESTPTSGSAPRLTASTHRHLAHVAAERPTAHKPRTLVALHGRNPMEALARETKVQVWPCKSGGICNWKR